MELYVQKFVTISSRKLLSQNTSEIYFAGTNLRFPFLPAEENTSMDNSHAIDLKHIKAEIDGVKKISKALLFKCGEPCLQSQALKSLMHHAKKQGLMVGLETYGTKPGLIQELLSNHLLDIVIIKLYSPLSKDWLAKMNKGSLRTDYQDKVDDIRKTLQCFRNSTLRIVLRTFVVPSLLYRKNDIMSLAKHAADLNATYELLPLPPGQYRGLKQPTSELMNELKESIKNKYTQLKLL